MLCYSLVTRENFETYCVNLGTKIFLSEPPDDTFDSSSVCACHPLPVAATEAACTFHGLPNS